jgi:hypothetical protein
MFKNTKPGELFVFGLVVTFAGFSGLFFGLPDNLQTYDALQTQPDMQIYLLVSVGALGLGPFLVLWSIAMKFCGRNAP